MVKVKKLLTPYNYTPMSNKRNMWIVIHYVGAESTAQNNAMYFYKAKRGASAHYFVDENEIYQIVEDTDQAWHVGGAIKYFNSCRNNNSIGIEMCCKKKDGKWYIEPETINKTIALTRYLMNKWNLPIDRVCRHYDVTGKICPEPFVRNEADWKDFLRRVKGEETMADVPERSMIEKYENVKVAGNFDDGTIDYFKKYIWREPLADKLDVLATHSLKWRKYLASGGKDIEL